MTKAGVGNLVQRLEVVYGLPQPFSGINPLEELVGCILSQHTSDKNSGPAYAKLRETYPTWEEIASLSQQELALTIRQAGIANLKAKSILLSLAEIHRRNGGYHLDNLDAMPVMEAREWLLSLPGVGPKTASIVLCFALGKGIVPVDTHVFRVGWRLGIYSDKIGEAKAHEVLLKLVPPELAFRYHMGVIQHGRIVCKAPVPNCHQCTITDLCRWFKRGGPAKRKAELEKRRQARVKPKARVPAKNVEGDRQGDVQRTEVQPLEAKRIE
jgi:endonuclease-3